MCDRAFTRVCVCVCVSVFNGYISVHTNNVPPTHPPPLSAVFNRQSVQRSLRSAQALLKSASPRLAEQSGLLLFAGPDIARLVYPPHAVPHSLYLCDRRFHTEMLEEMIAPKDKVGVVVCDGQTATVATLCGRQRTIHATLESAAKSRSRRGGQSALRFERLRDHAEHDYLKAIGEMMLRVFVTLNDHADPIPTVTRIILAGPAGTKNLLFAHCQTLPHLPLLLSSLITTTHAGLAGLGEAANRAGSIPRASPHLLRFLDSTGDARTCYGPEHVCAALIAGAVEVLLVDEEAAASLPLPPRVLAQQRTLVEWCVNTADEQGAEIVMCHPTCGEGVRFVSMCGGLGALLRWEFDTAEAIAAAEMDEREGVHAKQAAAAAAHNDQSDDDEGEEGKEKENKEKERVGVTVGVGAGVRVRVPVHVRGGVAAAAAAAADDTTHIVDEQQDDESEGKATSDEPFPPLSSLTLTQASSLAADRAERAITPENWDTAPSLLLLPPGLPVPTRAMQVASSSFHFNVNATEFVPGRVWGASL